MKHKIIISFYFLFSIIFCYSQNQQESKINIEHIKELQNTFPDDLGNGNSYYLQGMPAGYPVIGWSCAKSYQDCTVGFYDERFNLVGTYREPYYPGEKIMNIFSDDLDKDDDPEILMSVRMEKPGLVCLNWDPEKRLLKEKWIFSMDGKVKGAYHRGSIAGNFTDHPGKEVCFGSSRGILYLLTSEGKLITATALGRNKSLTIQRICTCDIDKDGYDEMIISTGRRPGMVTYCKWNSETLKLETIWQTNLTPDGKGGDNCYEAIFHPNGHPNGGPAIGAITEQETVEIKGSFVLIDMEGEILWQNILPRKDGRAGGCDFNDMDGDGIPELFGRYDDGKDNKGLVVFKNNGELLGKYPDVTASSSGPQLFYLKHHNRKDTYLVATSNVYKVSSK